MIHHIATVQYLVLIMFQKIILMKVGLDINNVPFILEIVVGNRDSYIYYIIRRESSIILNSQFKMKNSHDITQIASRSFLLPLVHARYTSALYSRGPSESKRRTLLVS
jgi:hypothetical protein